MLANINARILTVSAMALVAAFAFAARTDLHAQSIQRIPSGYETGPASALVSADGEQRRPEVIPLTELLSTARAVNAEIKAARRMADAAGARIPQAGALADPVLSAGVMNLRVNTFDRRDDDMTMGTVQVAQQLPAPGTRASRTAIAREKWQAAAAQVAEIELDVLTSLKVAYYEMLFIDHANTVLERSRSLLVGFAETARAAFTVGRSPQQDVLRAHTEITRLDEQIASLHARRTSALAQINAILLRPATSPFVGEYPKGVRALALSTPPPGAFTAAALDGGLGDDFPSLAELQRRAVEERPMLVAHIHRIAAAREGVRLARRERYPDLEVMVGYDTRVGRPDMLSASVSVLLPIFAARKQRQAVNEAQHQLAADELLHHQMVAEIEADVATRYAVLVRTREQLLLLRDGVIPQARATIESAAAAYQAGRIEFTSLLDAQATLFRNEIELGRLLSDFGRELAELERAIGDDLSLEDRS